MSDHVYYQHLGDNGQVAPAVVDRDDGVHLLADAPEVAAWLEAGNALLPAPARVREACGYAILNILTDDERAASLSSSVKVWDRLMIQARPTPFPETNEKVSRFAKGVGTTPKSLFDRAIGVGA